MSGRDARGKKRGWAENMAAGARHRISAGKAGGTLQDRFAAAEALAVGGAAVRAPAPVQATVPVIYLGLDEIRVREDAVRPVHEAHALDLALSIAAVGLIHFPVVNERNELIAGGQRRAAIEFLRLFATLAEADIQRLYASAVAAPDATPDLDGAAFLDEEQLALLRGAFERHFTRGVPVHRLDMSLLPPGTEALTIESIENEKRLDFSRTELASIVERLRVAGFRDRSGRPRAGERTLAEELERITGKSRRTVFRLLEELRAPLPEDDRAPSQTSRALARRLRDHFGVKVFVRDNPKKRGEGSIVIRYGSFQERADAIRKLGLRE